MTLWCVCVCVGLQCEDDDPCVSNPCRGGSVCDPVPANGSYQCSCERGWTGRDCDIDVNECAESICTPFVTIHHWRIQTEDLGGGGRESRKGVSTPQPSPLFRRHCTFRFVCILRDCVSKHGASSGPCHP